ncbi:MAG TPA: NF041680 family putative transposase [Stenomitos sp.]
MTSLEKLEKFRNYSYTILGNGRAALFDLMDAVLTSRKIVSIVELSLSPVFRRAWPSLYETLQDACVPRQMLMQHYVKQMPETALTILAGDHTAWSRPYAKTLQDRTYQHQPKPNGLGKPVVVGQGYSTLAWIPEAQGSWALPFLHERISSFKTPIEKIAQQLRAVCAQINTTVLFLADGEYGCAPFLKSTADIECIKLLRLRPNRVLYRAPDPYPGYGRPCKHGDKFALKDPSSWGMPQAQILLEDPKLGRLEMGRWEALHFQQAAEHPFEVIRVKRLDAPDSKPLWLMWVAPAKPCLTQVWQLYLRRFAIEHWYRFVRQRLHWTCPKFASLEQTQVWSDLMPLISWQLWLAREVVHDCPLPWQKPMPQLSPGRIANAFAPLLVKIGSPAPAPKPRGKSPGPPVGQQRKLRTRFPIVKKTYSKPSKVAKSAA